MTTLKLLLPLLLIPFFARTQGQTTEVGQWIDKITETVGGMDKIHALRDVQYTYHYGASPGTERYIFDGEVSYGKSTLKDGTVREQLHNGDEVRVWLNGKETTDADQIRSTTFSRPTSYYWLLMMQKMADPGVIATYGGKRDYEGIPYDLVDVTFDDNVGVAKDRYLLYVNPYTGLVDQFLFTVAAAGRMTPIMMKYTYGNFPGDVKLPIVSQSRAALNWEGDLDPEKEWGARHRADFSFGNGFTVENIREE